MDLTWLHNMREGTLMFLDHQREPSIPGAYRFSYSGDVIPTSGTTNLAGSIFALKAYRVLGQQDQALINPIIQRILSFQHTNGTFVDPFVWRESLMRNAARSFLNRQFSNMDNHEYVRAESRQAFSALTLYDCVPPRMMTGIPISPQAADQYLRRLDWSHPWGAGSHASHLLFFLSVMHRAGAMTTETFLATRQRAIDFLNTTQHQEDGAWYTGQPPYRQKVNGAMKVITGLVVDDLPFSFPERLIDLCLAPTTEPIDACDQINQVLVLRYTDAQCGGSYRRNEIFAFCHRLLQNWREYYHQDKGGFSFYRHHANSRYYAAKVSSGLNEPDLHGTLLFLWGLCLINTMLRIPVLEYLQEIKS